MSEAAVGRLDSLKWIVVLALVAGGVYGNSYYGDQPILYRVLALLALALVAGWVASLTQKGGDFLTLVKGSRTEIRKVVWPTRQATTQTTLIVFVFVIITGLILWGLDSVLGWLAFLPDRRELDRQVSFRRRLLDRDDGSLAEHFAARGLADKA